MYVELKNINKTFGETKASNDVSFAIEKGKLIGLLGPSGSGKTTILRMIAGLEHQDSGDIYIDGKNVGKLSPSERGIGFVFQNYALFPYLTVFENIAYGLRVQKKDKEYIKKRVNVGYVRSTDLAKAGTKIVVRTLEGDVDIATDEDTYIIIGVKGEIYPSKKEKFERGYEYSDEEYVFTGEYPPAVLESETGDRIELLPLAKSCIANGGTTIYARELTSRTKVFTSWDTEKYYLGKPGDFLATRKDDLHDIYVIAREIFFMTYGEV